MLPPGSPPDGGRPDAGRSDGGPDAGAGMDGGLPLKGACSALVTARCGYLQRCGLVAQGSDALRTCSAYFGATWCDASLWPARVEAQTLRYDPLLAAACAVGFATQSCSAWQSLPYTCSRFLSPNVYAGKGCYGDYPECRDNLVCRGSACPRSCQPLGNLDEPCTRNADCRGPLFCRVQAGTATGRCTAYGSLGSNCDTVDLLCAPDLLCSSGVCESRLSPGMPCGSTPECEAEAWCHLTPSDGGVCLARVDAGAPCADDTECTGGTLCQTQTGLCAQADGLSAHAPCSLRQSCAAGLWCVGASATVLGTCEVPRSPGQACSASADCEPHLACNPVDAGVRACGPRRDDGASCERTRDCLALSWCTGGTCASLPMPGSSCDHGPCLFGVCQAADAGATCTGMGVQGQSCSQDVECGSGHCGAGRCLAACAP